jgi:hypothetical protein
MVKSSRFTFLLGTMSFICHVNELIVKKDIAMLMREFRLCEEYILDISRQGIKSEKAV